MKVTNTFLNDNLILNNDKSLREGLFLKAKVLETSEEDITLALENGEILEAKTNINLSSLNNKLLTFLVKSIEDNKIFLQPIYQDDYNIASVEKLSVEKELKLFINKVLDTYSIPKTSENELIIKAILSLKMPLSQENILKTNKYLEKLDSLINLGNGEEIITVDSGVSPLNDSIMKLIKVDYNTENSGKVLSVDDPLNSNNNNFIDKNTKEVETSYREFINVTEMVKKSLKSILGENTSSMDFTNKTVLLMKLGHEISIDNYESLTKLLDSGEGMIRPFLDFVERLKVNNSSDNSLLIETLDKLSEIDIKTINFKDNNGFDKDSIKSFINKVNSLFVQIQSLKTNNKNLNKEVSIELEGLLQDMKLYQKFNSYFPFVQLPLMFNEENDECNITIMRKKNKSKKSNYVFYISLNTKNLKKVEIICNFDYEKVILDFIIEKELIEYFSKNIIDLKKNLEKLGLGIVIINLKEDKTNFPSNIFVDDDFLLNYNLNIRV
ncbi:MAG: hypothetical protein WDA24_08850 [Tissierellales bacterium]